MFNAPFFIIRNEHGLPGGIDEPPPPPPPPGCQRITTDQSGKPTEVQEYHPLPPAVLHWTGATSGATGKHIGYVYTITVYQPVTLYQQHIVLSEVVGTFVADEQLNPSIPPPGGVTIDIETHPTNPNQIAVDCQTVQPPVGFSSQYTPNQPIIIDDPFDPIDPEDPGPTGTSCPCAGGGGPTTIFPIWDTDDCHNCVTLVDISEEGDGGGGGPVSPVSAPISRMFGSGIQVGSDVRSIATRAEYRVVGMSLLTNDIGVLLLAPLLHPNPGAGFRPDDTLFLITDRTQQARVRSPIGTV